MKKIKIILMTLIILIIPIFATGCWNYREVDKLGIVAGVAVDRGTNGQYKLTIETVKISGGKDSKTTSKMIETEGKTMFDAVRNAISLDGKRLYWSHTKVIILSKEIAREGATKVIDWYNRDSETRPDVHILISEGNSAKEIFSSQGEPDEINSYVLDDMIRNQVSLSKAPITDILQFDNDLETKGLSAITPAIILKQIDGKMTPQIMGTAIFKKDRLLGFLNGDETKDLIFIKNQVKGGLLIEKAKVNVKDAPTLASLEIFKSKTKVIPVVNSGNISINLNIDTTVAIDEIEGNENFIDDEGRKKLEQSAENTLKEQIEALIEKIQSKYDIDIFGFGAKLREDKSKEWNRVGNNWNDIFKDLKVNVITKVHIRNSAMLSKPLEEGE